MPLYNVLNGHRLQLNTLVGTVAAGGAAAEPGSWAGGTWAGGSGARGRVGDGERGGGGECAEQPRTALSETLSG